MIEDRWYQQIIDPDTGKLKQKRRPRYGRGLRWKARITGIDGKERAKSFAKKDAARYWETAQLAALQKGVWIDPRRGQITISELADLWMESKVNIKPTTRAGYLSALAHIKQEFGPVKTQQLNRAAISEWIVKLMRAGMGPSHIRGVHQVLRAMLGYALRDGRLGQNVAEGTDLPRIPQRHHRYLTIAEVEGLATVIGRYKSAQTQCCAGWEVAGWEPGGREAEIHSIRRDTGWQAGTRPSIRPRERIYGNAAEQLALLVRILAYTGIRFGEAAALRVGCVDLARRRLKIQLNVTEAGGQQIFGTPKTHRAREVPLPAHLAEALAEWIKGKYSEDFVFATRNGTPLRARNVRREFTIAAHIVGVQGLRIHDLRHSAASLAISAGANVKVVQKMLGHKSTAMTLDVYCDLFDGDLDTVAEVMNGAFTRWEREAAS